MSTENTFPGREADPSHQSSAEVKSAQSYTSILQQVFIAWCLDKHRDNFTDNGRSFAHNSSAKQMATIVLLKPTDREFSSCLNSKNKVGKNSLSRCQFTLSECMWISLTDTSLKRNQTKPPLESIQDKTYIVWTGSVSKTLEYEGVSKSFRAGHVERELQIVQLSATRCSCIAILWVSLVSFTAITLCVASQWVFVIVVVYFVIDSVRELLDTSTYLNTVNT
jgi:hypothetical protein